MKRSLFIFALFVFGLAVLASAPTVQAATIAVNDAGDTTGACSATGTGTCTLRDAITYANGNAGLDTIGFNIPSGGACSSANTCTISLTSDMVHITDSVFIDGSTDSGHITVDGANSYQIFWAEADLQFNGLTVVNGNALLSSGGLYIASGVDAAVSNSTFRNNSAGSGAHIKNDGGATTIVNSTFFDTPSTAIGNLNSGTLNIYNSTIDGNNTSGSNGIVNTSGTTTLYNTIVTNNAGVDCTVGGGTLSADSYNIDNDGTCDNATSRTVAALALFALANNGGPTPTMQIDNDSAAFNAGDNTVCAQALTVNNLDQRGDTRPAGLWCDVGAYEYQYTGFQTGPNFVVNTTSDNDDGSCDILGQGVGNQDCSLREAINTANKLSGADTITFNIPDTDGGCSAVNTCTITLGGNLPHLQEQVTIDGAPNNGHITVDGASLYQIFWAEADTTLNALTVSNGSALLSSGGLYIASGVDAAVSNSTFRNNSAGSGAHIKNDGGATTIVNSTFFDTPSTAIGNLNSGTLNIYNSTIDGNNTSGSNGIANTSGTTTLYNTIVTNNAGVDCTVGGGTLSADSYNIDNDGTCDNATQKTSVEINLQPLANNGGPTFTMALVIPSAALNVGNNAVCTAAPVNGLDQRGVTRPQGTQCDVGAYEATGTTAVNVTGMQGHVNAKGDGIVKWKTTSEAQIAGFNVYRKLGKGEWKEVNTRFKQAKHPGDAAGEKYRFVDKTVEAGKTYRYRVQVVYLDGHTEWTAVVKVKSP